MAEVMNAIRTLLAASTRARPEDLPDVTRRLATDLGAADMTLYLVDYSQTALMPHVGAGTAERAPLPIDATIAGRAFTTGRAVQGAVDADDPTDEPRYRWWLPLIHGAERLGVLELLSPVAPETRPGPEYDLAAAVLAQVVATSRMYGDAVEHTRRRLPMQLAAEIIWSQLPPLTFTTADIAVSSVLEPCYDVGGDAFDYAINGDVLHVAMFDAVGHGINASALTALAINAYRNARRCGLDLSDTYRSIDKWVHDQYPEKFVTAILAELHVPSGTYRRIAAGHPGELLLRDGSLVKELPSPTALPLGLGHLDDPIPTVVEESLQPGDRILLYTDGVIEARTDTGEYFGLDRLRDFITNALTSHLPGAETMRRLVRAILAHQHDQLQDDASAALVEWRPEFNPGPHNAET